MKPGWYILLYHDVSWEESPFLRGIGGMVCPPDVFYDHLHCLSRIGRLVSVPQGLDRASSGNLTRPLFSCWFDDGYSGVLRYALSILQDFGIEGAVSVCSRFVDREELFWRAKLSYLSYIDGQRILRSRMRKNGFKRGMRLKDFTMNCFSEEVLASVDAVFEKLVSPENRRDAFRLFMDREGLTRLKDSNWVLANHTAAHYPVGEDTCIDLLQDQFSEGEKLLEELCDANSDFWVLPFDRQRSERFAETFRRSAGERYLVLVGNRGNDENSIEEKAIYRLVAPICAGRDLVRHLRRQGL